MGKDNDRNKWIDRTSILANIGTFIGTIAAIWAAIFAYCQYQNDIKEIEKNAQRIETEQKEQREKDQKQIEFWEQQILNLKNQYSADTAYQKRLVAFNELSINNQLKLFNQKIEFSKPFMAITEMAFTDSIDYNQPRSIEFEVTNAGERYASNVTINFTFLSLNITEKDSIYIDIEVFYNKIFKAGDISSNTPIISSINGLKVNRDIDILAYVDVTYYDNLKNNKKERKIYRYRFNPKNNSLKFYILLNELIKEQLDSTILGFYREYDKEFTFLR